MKYFIVMHSLEGTKIYGRFKTADLAEAFAKDLNVDDFRSLHLFTFNADGDRASELEFTQETKP